MANKQGLSVHIRGIVQGVGFRPFVYSLAARYDLKGWVRNTTRGVEIEVDGNPDQLSSFLKALSEEAPPLAKIDSIHSDKKAPNGFTKFTILHSQSNSEGFQPISPDMNVCDDCLAELFDPGDRRYRYPFINCTNCGPRFTIIQDIPYDRPETTMAPFEMCDDCADEYNNPLDRRFHAQPVACPDCGPHVWLAESGSAGTGLQEAQVTGNRAILETQNLLAEGNTVAIKGLGGFHLACDAASDPSVQRLREGKDRPAKPLAVMMPDLETVSRFCLLDEDERELLLSPQRPIVLLEKKDDLPLSPGLAPGQDTLGVMLPYTPLHYLLFSREDRYPHAPYPALVMTSGNRGNQPIVTTNDHALEELGHIAHSFLFHNRDIHVHCDDSVTRIADSQPYPLRRSRGYAPFPIKLQKSGPTILAAGAELKNTFCLLKKDQAFLSQHIGDLENYQTFESFTSSLSHFEDLFRAQPDALAYDLHPDYLASRYAQERADSSGIPAVGVQHHFAHIVSCLAEHGVDKEEPVIGFSFDGTGYGEDGHIWGGEVLVANHKGYHRAFHLAYAPLPGGEKAIKEPWRFALAWLHQLGLDWDHSLPPVRFAQERYLQDNFDPLSVLRNQIETKTLTPLTSSMGRLFDAVSALTGIRCMVNYEAQAAIELQSAADPDEPGSYDFDREDGVIHPDPVFASIIADLQAGNPPGVISARFHNGLARAVRDVSIELRERYDMDKVALSGGVWQNTLLLENTLALLREAGFTVLTHRRVPANDGGLSLGQAVIARQVLES